MSLIEWANYVDNVGYIDYDHFLTLPATLLNYIMAIRVAQSMREAKDQLSETKDSATRKKLSSNIQRLDRFFNGRE